MLFFGDVSRDASPIIRQVWMVKCVVFMCLQGDRNVQWSLLIDWFALRTYPDSGLMAMCFWRSNFRACFSFLCFSVALVSRWRVIWMILHWCGVYFLLNKLLPWLSWFSNFFKIQYSLVIPIKVMVVFPAVFCSVASLASWFDSWDVLIGSDVEGSFCFSNINSFTILTV